MPFDPATEGHAFQDWKIQRSARVVHGAQARRLNKEVACPIG